jgi:hypothetical protein
MKGREMSEQKDARAANAAHVRRQVEEIMQFYRELFAKREAKENAD